MTEKNKPPVIPPPTGTEDKAQLRALGEYMGKVARGEITPPDPKAPAHTVPQWGFTPEQRERLERERDEREAAAAKKAPPPPKP